MLNARSIYRKLALFQSIVYSTNHTIYCITETWLTDLIFDSEILPANYSIFRKDRISRGGGVLVAVDSSLSCHEVPSPPELEVVTVRIGHILVCTVYIPPNTNINSCSNLLYYLSDLTSTSENIIIVGDFNAPDIEWSSLSGTQSQSNLICDFVFNSNLTQLVEEPTHTRGNTLDIVLTNIDFIYNLQVHKSQSTLSSDHYPITFEIGLSRQSDSKRKHQYVYDYSKADMEGLSEFLLNCNIDTCYLSNDAEFVWNVIDSHIQSAMDLFIPKRKRLKPNTPCWYNSEIRHRLKCLRTLTRKKRRRNLHSIPN